MYYGKNEKKNVLDTVLSVGIGDILIFCKVWLISIYLCFEILCYMSVFNEWHGLMCVLC